MRSCTEFISLHENTLGVAGYCYGCESFHLKMKGLLSVVSDVQLGVIEENLVQMPRTVNFITGPSRSGDIEQTLLLGAHGPRRLHIILVESE